MKIVFTTFIAIFFISCSTSNIQYNNKNTLQIITDSKTITKFTAQEVYQNRVNLSNINIYQYALILDSGTLLIYEDIKLTSGYKFTYGINRTIGIAFPNYTYDLLGSKGNMQFYKLSNTKETLYMIVQNLNKRALKVLYGFDKQMFDKIKIAFKKRDTFIDTQSVSVISSLDTNSSHYIKSSWNVKNIILDNIISKVGSRNAIR